MSQQNMKCRVSELGTRLCIISNTNVPASLDSTVGQNKVDFSLQWANLGRDRFESTASAGRRIHSASPIDLPLAIPEDPLPSSAKGGGRR